MIFTAIFVFSVNDLSSSLPLFVLNQGIHLFLYWFVSILIDRFLYKNTNLCYPWIFFSLFFVCLLIFMVAFAMSKNQKCEIGWSVFSFLVLLWLMLLKRTLLSYISSFLSSLCFSPYLGPWSWGRGGRHDQDRGVGVLPSVIFLSGLTPILLLKSPCFWLLVTLSL